MHTDSKQSWEKYKECELQEAHGLLTRLGIVLEAEQPHIGGERYLMSGRKLVLFGTYKGVRAVLKISSNADGKKEIRIERAAREKLQNLRFAYEVFVLPKELIFYDNGDFVVFVTAYIAQERTFLERPLREQFNLLLRALKSQEAVHATTSAHAREIRSTFGIWGAEEYMKHAALFLEEEVSAFLAAHREDIERYCGFLTHSDFLPHNLRVAGENIYLLDSSSLHFGNKHESWARVLNFMLLYNPELERALVHYLRDNRAEEEYTSLRAMRVYKAGYLVHFYKQSLARTEGALRELTEARIVFWRGVIRALIHDTPLETTVIEHYKAERDRLRSAEEKERQKELH